MTTKDATDTRTPRRTPPRPMEWWAAFKMGAYRLISPDGAAVAEFNDLADATHAAECLNNAAKTADALAVAASMIERVLQSLNDDPRNTKLPPRAMLERALAAINAAPGREVIRPANASAYEVIE